MVAKCQNIVQFPSGLLHLKISESVSKMNPIQGALKPRIQLRISSRGINENIKAVASINHFTFNEIIHNALKKENQRHVGYATN